MLLITTLVVSFCKDRGGSINVKLWFLVVYLRCEVVCRLAVDGNVFLQPSDRELHPEHTSLRTIILH